MPRATINIAEPSGQAITDTTWRFAVGYIPGEPNLGLVGEAQGGSPARLADYDDSELGDLQRSTGPRLGRVYLRLVSGHHHHP